LSLWSSSWVETAVPGVGEIRDVLRIDPLRRFEDACQKRDARRSLADRRQLRSDFLPFLADAVAILAWDACGLEKDLLAAEAGKYDGALLLGCWSCVP
jgi:hypothetical protein